MVILLSFGCAALIVCFVYLFISTAGYVSEVQQNYQTEKEKSQLLLDETLRLRAAARAREESVSVTQHRKLQVSWNQHDHELACLRQKKDAVQKLLVDANSALVKAINELAKQIPPMEVEIDE